MAHKTQEHIHKTQKQPSWWSCNLFA